MKTKIMGILNTTPDSFFDKGRFHSIEDAISHAKQLVAEGADILDVGGESTRPNAVPVTADEELQRVIPIISVLTKETSIPISVDTRHPEVAAAALRHGATFINDVSGFSDPRMVELAGVANVPICVMHMPGTPQTMQQMTDYPHGVIDFLMHWFQQKIETLLEKGIKKDKIILDPGIGFGKTVADNFKIIQNLQKFRSLGFPLLYGISRKSFMGKTLHKNPEELLPATIALNTLLILNDVDYIRVHDVAAHSDARNVIAHARKSLC